jgi:hypothetical protein
MINPTSSGGVSGGSQEPIPQSYPTAISPLKPGFAQKSGAQISVAGIDIDPTQIPAAVWRTPLQANNIQPNVQTQQQASAFQTMQMVAAATFSDVSPSLSQLDVVQENPKSLHTREDLRAHFMEMYQAAVDIVDKKYPKKVDQYSSDPIQEKKEKEELNQKMRGKLIGVKTKIDNLEFNGEQVFSRESLNKEITANDKELLKFLQKKSKEIEKDLIAGLRKANIPNAQNKFGEQRFLRMHQKDIFQKGFRNKIKIGDKTFDNSITPVGKARSSQEPRRITDPSKAHAANNFKTTFNKFWATRSAVPVEFDCQDPQKRGEVTRAVVQNQLDIQADFLLQGLSDEELSDAETNELGITLNLQTTTLLTPDSLRNIVRRFGLIKKLKVLLGADPANDERALARENLEAHKHFNGKDGTYKITRGGREYKVKVNYKISYFNIPNNQLYEKLPKFLTNDKTLRDENNKSWRELSTKVEQKINFLSLEILKTKLPREELTKIGNLKIDLEMANKLRLKVCENTKRNGFNKEDPDFKKWQEESIKITAKIKRLREDPTTSPDGLKFLEKLQELQTLQDLYLDTKELYEGGLGKDMRAVDNNRSALASRIILLGNLAGNQCHFGCRSGKDRTGIVDIEIKTLLALSELMGRVPSFREQERLGKQERIPEIKDIRYQISVESGNVRHVTEGATGAPTGLNITGCYSDPLQGAENYSFRRRVGKHTKAFPKRAAKMIAGQPLQTRPKTNLEIEASKTCYEAQAKRV